MRKPSYQFITLSCCLVLAALAMLTACGRILPGSLPVTLEPVAGITTDPATRAPAVEPSPSPTNEPTSSPTPEPTLTPTPTRTTRPTETLVPSETPNPTITLTPTFDFPDVTVQMQANCRYGPGQAYLYSHGLNAGDQAEVHGRNYSGSWLWIQPENLERHCWVSASVVEIQGDVLTVVVFQSNLPQSTLYGSPENVQAERDGDLVTVTWDPVWMTKDDDRGYLIEATVCQDGLLIPIAVHTDDPGYELVDETRCSGESSGLLYTVEKHGYTVPVQIPWP